MSHIDKHSMISGVVVTALAHPLTYCKVLVQLGHEPLAPVVRRNIFFRKQLQYPSVIQYMKHIKAEDGILGLYRGLPYRLLAHAATTITYIKLTEFIESGGALAPPAEPEEDGVALVKKVARNSCRETVVRCCAIVVSHPFHVIAIRSMAQFIGHEEYYSGLFSSFSEIYNEEGILGFFSGLVPRLVAEVAHIWICNLLAHIINKYALKDQPDLSDLQQYTQAVTSYIAGVITYPITLTSTVMAVSGSRLAAGNPPNMPCYDGWFKCLTDLRKTGLLNRGSSVIFRPVLRYAVQATKVTPMPPPPPIPR